MITHYDLFAGIGGFSIAVDEVWGEPVRHIFCEWEKFPTEVLKKHWPDGEYWGDIADLVAHTQRSRRNGGGTQVSSEHSQEGVGGKESELRNKDSRPDREFTIVTGGFPCQPFSQAGQRRGTADDRYKWPEMFEVIRNVSPDWIIAENVAGLVSWSEGMVLEQVCTDLEGEGYEVWPLVIPAVAVNAPHRRDRVWIIGHAKHARRDGSQDRESTNQGSDNNQTRQNESVESKRPDSLREDVANTILHSQGSTHRGTDGNSISGRQKPNEHEGGEVRSDPRNRRRYGWEADWTEVAIATCNDGMDDGLSRIVGGVPYSRAKWRKESLKAYGNAIVPQVAIEIMKGIRDAQK